MVESIAVGTERCCPLFFKTNDLKTGRPLGKGIPRVSVSFQSPVGALVRLLQLPTSTIATATCVERRIGPALSRCAVENMHVWL